MTRLDPPRTPPDTPIATPRPMQPARADPLARAPPAQGLLAPPRPPGLRKCANGYLLGGHFGGVEGRIRARRPPGPCDTSS